jgi:hypothetical protein
MPTYREYLGIDEQILKRVFSYYQQPIQFIGSKIQNYISLTFLARSRRRTNDTPAFSLLDHLLHGVFVAKEYTTGIDGKDVVPILDGG